MICKKTAVGDIPLQLFFYFTKVKMRRIIKDNEHNMNTWRESSCIFAGNKLKNAKTGAKIVLKPSQNHPKKAKKRIGQLLKILRIDRVEVV